MNGEKETLCRACLSTNLVNCKSLFQTYKNALLFEYMNMLVNIKIRQHDGYPELLCAICFTEFETAINFKEKCENSNILLQKYTLNKEPIHIIKDVIVKKEEFKYENTDYDDNNWSADYVPSNYINVDSLKEDVPVEKKEVGQLLKPIELKVQCHDCGDFFKSKCKLRVHWKKIHMLKSLVCTICKRLFKSYKAYHSHIKKKTKSCNVGASGMVDIFGIGKARIFNCKECPYSTKRVKDIKSHLVIHSRDRPFSCEICPKTFTQLSSLQTHKEFAHKMYKVEITCHICGEYLKGRTQAYRHIKNHTIDKVPCSICKKLLNKKSLRPHMQRHSGVKSYTCEKCASTFYTSAELCNHRRTVHNGLGHLYQCKLCEYKSKRSDIIKKHQKKHTAVNIPCIICGRFLDNKQKLNLHRRIHFEDKKYSCPHCDVKFHGRDSVRKHIKVKHQWVFLSKSKSPPIIKEDLLKLKISNEEKVKVETLPT